MLFLYKKRSTFFVLLHITVITVSNVLVQFPFKIAGLYSTWGVLPYPCIFILSDLTTRLYDARFARKIVYTSMIPAFFISLLVPFFSFSHIDLLVTFRVAIASFSAYVLGQLLDILLFSHFRTNYKWYIAPVISAILANIFDTYFFFFIAFYHTNQSFLASYWPEIASVDLCFKLIVSLCLFIPFYGLLLSMLVKKQTQLKPF